MKRFLAAALVAALICCLPVTAAADYTLTLPARLTRIETEAFAGDESLSRVVVPDSVSYIGPRAFDGCAGLTAVFIPATVNYIGEDAFPEADNLVIWGEVGSRAQIYADQHGITFRTTTIVTEDGIVLSVRGGAWAVTGYVGEDSDLVLPAAVDDMTVVSIESYAFCSCTALRSVLIPDSVTAIAGDAFVDNPNLITLYGREGSCAQDAAEAAGLAFVDPYIHMYQQPIDLLVPNGEDALFAIEAGNVALFRWQVREGEDAPWTDVGEGVGEDGWLTVAYDAANEGRQFRCELVGVLGDTLYSDIVGLTYYEPVPQAVVLTDGPIYMGTTDQVALKGSVEPPEACQDLIWTSSNPAAASVDQAGHVTARAAGTTTITATAANGLARSVTVRTTYLLGTTVIPARVSGTGELSANMQRIEAVRLSAVSAVDSLLQAGTITSGEASSRKAVINRAFAMQAFPWMTRNTQEYWSSANAHKRFLPGNVYYGMPYIQCGTNGNYSNRRYNVDKALSENRFYSSGSGYYLLNQNRLLNGMYVGNDCSAFVSMSNFGLNHTASFLTTSEMASSRYYKSTTYMDLRPGDSLLRSGHHTVMFLYWVDVGRSKAMVIEQGGTEVYGTILCSVKSMSSYKSYYTPRRLSSFD